MALVSAYGSCTQDYCRRIRNSRTALSDLVDPDTTRPNIPIHQCCCTLCYNPYTTLSSQPDSCQSPSTTHSSHVNHPHKVPGPQQPYQAP